MKTRAELFSIFQKFHADIRTQFITSIRILRSDNAKKYLHQFSCAYSSQQNGVVEYKNRHLVETARTLLLHHKNPQRFWGDAILATCYLINRMPSSVLHDQIPHSILFPNQPLFCIPPCVFGCVLFIFLLLGKTSSQLKQLSVSSWVILDFRGVIDVILLTQIGTSSPLMSLSLRVPLSSPLKSILMFQMSYMSLLSYHLQISLLHLRMF